MMNINEMLEGLGSQFRVPEETDPWEGIKQGWIDELITGEMVDPLMAFLNENHPREPEVGPEGYTFTAEDIVNQRDEMGLGWRQVAVNLDLGTSSSARRAYRRLTGRDPKTSKPKVRRAKTTMGTAKTSRRKVFMPEWDDESDQDEIIQRCEGARLIVRRRVGEMEHEEDLRVRLVRSLTWDGVAEALTLNFCERDTGGMRSIRVTDIQEVR